MHIIAHRKTTLVWPMLNDQNFSFKRKMTGIHTGGGTCWVQPEKFLWCTERGRSGFHTGFLEKGGGGGKSSDAPHLPGNSAYYKIML